MRRVLIRAAVHSGHGAGARGQDDDFMALGRPAQSLLFMQDEGLHRREHALRESVM